MKPPGNILICLLSGFFILNASPTLGTPLCERAFRDTAVKKLLDSQDRGKHTVLLVDALIRAVKRARFRNPKDRPAEVLNAYSHLLLAAHVSGRTMYEPLRKLKIKDTPVVLELPKAGEPTIWEKLTPGEREALVERIEAIFQTGVYADEFLSKDMPRDVALLFNVRGAILASDNEKIVRGLSPTKIFVAASQSKNVGVCRHGTCAMAGLLREFGVPADHIRLVYGKKAPDADIYHIWLEYKAHDSSEWIEADPTARRSRFDNLLDALLGKKKLEPLRHKARRNRERFSHDQSVITDPFSQERTGPIPSPADTNAAREQSDHDLEELTDDELN